MRKLVISSIFAAVVGLFSQSAQADWSWNQDNYYGQTKSQYNIPTEQTITGPSYCYDAGFDFGVFLANVWPEGTANNGIGGGLSLSYFLDRNFGLEASYAAFAKDAVDQVFSGRAIYRLPMEGGGFCGAWAPYIHGEIGGISDDVRGKTDTYFGLGAGVDMRFQSWGCMGVFADFTYGFADDNTQDFIYARLGMKFPF